MTYEKAKTTVGGDIRIGRDYVGCIDCTGRPFLIICGDTDKRGLLKRGLDKLVAENLSRSREVALERDQYRCQNCGEFGAMHADHIRMRSHGRDDRPSNLRTLCAECHELRHRMSRTFNQKEI